MFRLINLVKYLNYFSTIKQARLNSHTENVRDIINTALDARGFPNNNEVVTQRVQVTSNVFAYDGKFWDVPKDFEFPGKMRIKSAWNCWLVGLPNYEVDIDGVTHQIPIKTFCSLKPSRLPRKLKLWIRNNLIPFTKMMEKAPDLVIDSETDITDDFVNTSFDIGIAFIKSRVEYMFVNSNWRHYSVSTICKKLKHGKIMKHGTRADKRRSEEDVTHHNRHRPRCRLDAL